MINYKNRSFKDFIDLFDHMVNKGFNVNYRVFPHSQIYYIRYSLQQKFNRPFTLKQTKEYLAEELALNHITLLHKQDEECI